MPFEIVRSTGERLFQRYDKRQNPMRPTAQKRLAVLLLCSADQRWQRSGQLGLSCASHHVKRPPMVWGVI